MAVTSQATDLFVFNEFDFFFAYTETKIEYVILGSQLDCGCEYVWPGFTDFHSYLSNHIGFL